MLSVQSKQNKPMYRFIPEELEPSFRYEVFHHYTAAGRHSNTLCLDADIVNHMTFMLLSVIHFHETGSKIDEALMDNKYEWAYLIQKYPAEEYRQEAVNFREDIKGFLDARNMMYEENWVYARETNDYLFRMNNEPLQSVW